MQSINQRLTCAVLLAAALGLTATAFAADAPAAGTLEEIVVTAQKKVETVQEVPVSITVLSAEQLDRQGVATISDLSRSSASLEFGAPGTSSPGGGAYVRGIGTNSFGYTAQASVGLVLDGVVMGNANILSLYDISRVEVLKGPQGTLFGNSVSAGVINITTNAPDPHKKSFTVSTEYGADALGSDYSRYVVRAAANLPLSDTSAIRITTHSERNAGVFRNVWLGTDSQDQDNGVRVRYLSRPSDELTINLIGDYDSVDTTNVPTLLYRIAPTSGMFPNSTALANALADCGVTAGESNFNTCSENEDFSHERTKGLSAQIDYNLGSATLTSISSYRARYTGTRGDIEAIPLAIAQNRLGSCGFFDCVPIFGIQPGYGPTGPQVHDKSQYSEELRVSSNPGTKLDWTVGAFYLHYKDDIDEGGRISAFFTGGGFAPTGKFAAVKNTDYAGFANFTYHFTDTFRGIAGLRYTHSTVSENETDIANPPPDRYLEVSASKLSYRLAVQQDFAPHVMGYLSLATGYKGPQISDSLDPVPTSDPNVTIPGKLFGVNPELPTSIEVGIKASAFGNRLALDADLFYTDVKDYQGQRCFPNSQGTITCVPTNVSGVKTKGVEVDIFGQPVAGLTLNLNAIYNPAEYPAGYRSADGSDLGGTQLTRSSKTKIALSAEYSFQVTDTTQFVLGADTVYRSKQSIYPSAASMFIVDSNWTTNARMGFRFGDDWSAFLFGRNLGETRFPRDLFPTPFMPGGLWQVYDAGSRKVIGIQIEAKFQ